MADVYDHAAIDCHWQKQWAEQGQDRVDLDSPKPKYYCLVMFPYSSGDLHIGHWYNFAPADVFARHKRMQGFNVLFPIGYDSFGLPAEQAAITRGIHPHQWTEDSVSRMTQQLHTTGSSFEWERLVATHRADYYHWTQWMFLLMYRRGLAYKALGVANWCPACRTVLANEQAEGGKCWRCQGEVIQKEIEQWFFRITDYAQELLDDLEQLDWPERTVASQRHWLGKSTGVEINFTLEDGTPLPVFTTRPDTIYGVSFMAVAPEHPLLGALTSPERETKVKAYVEACRRRTELDRISDGMEKTGVFTGSFVTNPLNNERVPVFAADYVLMSYGTGAVMGVPAHDQRDWLFAKQYDLPIKEVISGGEVAKEAFTAVGTLVNSAPFDGRRSDQALESIAAHIEQHKLGKRTVNWHLRDWLVSRQRYWGAPIPIIYCDSCGMVPVPEADLPVLLPEKVDFTPSDTSPLGTNAEFLNTTCPACGKPARRDTDTMDTFVDSSWYYLRYLDPRGKDAPFNQELARHWMPVDMYIGGAEHTVMHLLYSRFFTKVLRDAGYLTIDEPFQALRHQGIILGPDGQRMSKSRGNVVNPDTLVGRYGADAVRMYLCFMSQYDQGGPWDPNGIDGVYRFLQRVWRMVTGRVENIQIEDADPGEVPSDRGPLCRALHRTIRKVGLDIEGLRFNTAVAALMELVNLAYQQERVGKDFLGVLVRLLAPYAPHLAEELWAHLGGRDSVLSVSWPEFDPELLVDDMVTIVVQINGKVRDRLDLPRGTEPEVVEKAALSTEIVKRHLEGKSVVKIILVPDRLLNIVAR